LRGKTQCRARAGAGSEEVEVEEEEERVCSPVSSASAEASRRESAERPSHQGPMRERLMMRGRPVLAQICEERQRGRERGREGEREAERGRERERV